MASSIPSQCPYDVIIIGGGISGIHAAYCIQQKFPDWTYTILEGRNALGGTWDLFRYPGIRSDSDLHTFGFSWYPWPEKKAFAQGKEIAQYIAAAAKVQGIDQHVQFETTVSTMDWSSSQNWWRVDAETGIDACDESRTIRKSMYARHVIFGTGYYDYSTPLQTTIPGLSDFKGQVIHPQFWPQDLDFQHKRVAVIGSGATAVTLVPELTKLATKVTMIQRSPSYILPRPTVDVLEDLIQNLFPQGIRQVLLRWKNILFQFLLFCYCRCFPGIARRWLKNQTQQQLPSNIPHNPHFEPDYNPWEQRLCVCPDGDFFAALRSGNATVNTGHITSMTADSISLSSGEIIPADIIVTATGLKLLFAGGIKVYVDHEPINLPEKFIWNGIMVQDLPNCAFLVGSTNASWTLGIETSMSLICRVLGSAKEQKSRSVTARVPEKRKVKEVNLLDLNSTYLRVARDQLPKAGHQKPWAPRAVYYKDYLTAHYGDLRNGLEYSGNSRDCGGYERAME